MEQVGKVNDLMIFKKKSGRYAIQDSKTKKWVNGDAKVEVLVAESLIKPQEKKPAS